MPNNALTPEEKQAKLDALPYFAKLLPWQLSAWETMTSLANDEQKNLPHALLASGNKGIGKRAFVWRWVAWQLCHNKQTQSDKQTEQGKAELHACGECQSCLWLKAGTHPDVSVLPHVSSPTFGLTAEPESSNTKKSKAKKSTKSTKAPSTRIKIDDIRTIQDFVNHTSSNIRICVFDHAEQMTLGAANALLKTLEEPQHGIQLILITDKPTELLPTIKSRVQQLPINKIDIQLAQLYLQKKLGTQHQDSESHIQQLLDLSGFAPLSSIQIATSQWYILRQAWLAGWLALRTQARTPAQAMDFWFNKLKLEDFIQLTLIMLTDLQRIKLGLPAYQKDLDVSKLDKNKLPDSQNINKLIDTLFDVDKSIKQNVQEKLAYDMLMQKLSEL